MVITRYSELLVLLTIILLASCASPTSLPPNIAPITPVVTPSPVAAPTPTQTAQDKIASKIDDYLASLVKLDRFSGSVLAAIDGKTLISKGYGMANNELDVPNTPQTKFRIASLTKQFTTMAILMLQQQGKLKITDHVCQYIQDCPEAWQPITLHHLLTHTSGIPEFGNAPDIIDFAKRSVNPSQVVDRFRDLPLDFTPGEKYSYSNSGYSLLGAIIEKVSSEPYVAYLQQNIFEPLRMANTGYEGNRSIIKQRASGYINKNTNADSVDMTVFFSSGGLYSTVEDLLVWDQALYTDTLIPQSLRDEMFKPHVLIPDTQVSYGYGWAIGEQFNHTWIFHNGQLPGFQSEIARYPDDRAVIIVLSNREDTNVELIVSDIAQMIFEEK